MTTEIPLFEKQIKFFNLTEEEALLDAGIGYGKSRVASIWLASMVQQHPRTRWFMAARDYKQLKSSIDPEFEMYLNDILGIEKGKHYHKVGGSPITYEFTNGSMIYGVGAHNYDTVFRAGNYSGAWGDEVDFWKPEAIQALRGRIRVHPQIKRFTSSPKGFNHIYQDFYVNKVGPVIRASSYENPTLSQSYFDTLKKTYSPKMFEQEVMGKRLNLKLGQVYDEFSREKHVRECRSLLDDSDQIYFFTDYNVANYCGVYMIYKNDTVYAIGEEHLKFKTSKVMAEHVKAKYPNRPIIVVGDSTGNNKRDVAIEKTNYEHFKDAGLLTQNFRNPPVETRIIAAQSHLHHEKLVIDPSCPTLIKDLELLAWKEDGSGIDKSNIDLSHAADAWNYGVWYFKPILPKARQKIVLR